MKKMGKNLIPIIAKELGVEIGEEFRIAGSPAIKYRFKNNKMEGQYTVNDDWEIATPLINSLGDVEVIKLPFEPKEGDYYWTYAGDDFCIIRLNWNNRHVYDWMCKACGCVFRTEEEAIKARSAKYKELTGKEWNADD